MGHAVALVDLYPDSPLDAEVDEPLLPLLGIDALGIAERLKRRERGMAEDVDAIAVDPLGDDFERAFEYPFLERGVGEPLPLLPSFHPTLHECTRVVVGDARAVDLD